MCMYIYIYIYICTIPQLTFTVAYLICLAGDHRGPAQRLRQGASPPNSNNTITTSPRYTNSNDTNTNTNTNTTDNTNTNSNNTNTTNNNTSTPNNNPR